MGTPKTHAIEPGCTATRTECGRELNPSINDPREAPRTATGSGISCRTCRRILQARLADLRYSEAVARLRAAFASLPVTVAIE